MVSLGSEQVRQFRDQGFLALPGLFAFDEIAWVRDEAQAVALRSTARGSWPEEAPEGAIYGADAKEDVFGRLVRHPRILAAARALLGDDLYIHQSRLLTWRAPGRPEGRLARDFSSWAALDGMKAPHAVTAAVLLEDAAYEPALSVVASSHRQEGLSQGGSQRLVPVAGGIGSVVVFDANLAYVLGAAGDRPHHRLFLISFNRLDNQPAHPRGGAYSAATAQVPVAEVDDSLWPAPWCAAG
jgi:ectoine hydroxylase